MIDTVILNMPNSDFRVVLHERFTPSSRGLWQAPYLPKNESWGVKCVQNVKEEGIVLPSLTLFKRGFDEISLKVEFSVSKLLFSNNFEELSDQDFERVVELLKARLFRMGVVVSVDAIKRAKVSACHYSKNVVFTDYTSVSGILSLLSKIKLTHRLDLNKTQFVNDGQAVRYHCKSYSLIFYDKIADLKHSVSTAVEKEDRAFNIQYNIFDEIRRKKCPLEVLRIEFRFCDRDTLKRWFKKLSIINDYTFEAMFKSSVSKQVLSYFWQETFKQLKPLLFEDCEDVDLAELIVKQYPKWNFQRVMTVITILRMFSQSGERKLSNVITTRFNNRTLQRGLADTLSLNVDVSSERMRNFKHITQAIEDFIPLNKSDYRLNYYLENNV